MLISSNTQYYVLFVLAVVIAYFLGSISPSTIIGRMHGIDIKKAGSGNAGTTNTLRVLGKKAALITLIVDIGKGVLAVVIGNLMAGHTAAMFCAVAAFIGHLWPLIFKFKGGKGVAVAFGVVLGINWKLGLLALAITVAGVLISKKMSVGSITVAVAFPFICFWLQRDFFWFGVIMAVLILIKHRSNMVKLYRHQEDNMKIFKKRDDR